MNRTPLHLSRRDSLTLTGVRLFCLLGLLFALPACSGDPPAPAPTTTAGTPLGSYEPSIPLTSAAFVRDQPIPKVHSCDGRNSSPPLQWGDTLPDVKSFALIMDDPDAPGGAFVHWVAYNLPPTSRSLPGDLPATASIEGGGTQGVNGTGKQGYTGPCPPGGTHHYVFKLYALNITLDLAPGATKAQLEQAMVGHVLAYGELVGTYER